MRVVLYQPATCTTTQDNNKSQFVPVSNLTPAQKKASSVGTDKFIIVPIDDERVIQNETKPRPCLFVSICIDSSVYHKVITLKV